MNTTIAVTKWHVRQLLKYKMKKGLNNKCLNLLKHFKNDSHKKATTGIH